MERHSAAFVGENGIINSLKESRKNLFSNRDMSYCYWRFGRAFSNYTDVPTDRRNPVILFKDGIMTTIYYDEEISDSDRDKNVEIFMVEFKNKCDRLSGKEKRYECYYGIGATGYTEMILNSNTNRIFGDNGSMVIAEGLGSFRDLDACFMDGIPEQYYDPCVRGHIESIAIEKYLNIPCLKEENHFSGLRKIILESLTDGTIKSEALKCDSRNINKGCSAIIGYCGAVEGNKKACHFIGDARSKKDCEYVYNKLTFSNMTYDEKELSDGERHQR